MIKLVQLIYLQNITHGFQSFGIIVDNNFNTMEIAQIQQSPRIAKISKTTLQFRQLIDSLRNSKMPERLPIVSTSLISHPKEQEVAQESTVVASQNKTVSQSNNYLLLNESQTTLKSKAKVEVGDRDKLKKKAFVFDSNPQLQANEAKIEQVVKGDSFFQNGDKKQKNLLMPLISPLKDMSTQYDQNEQNSVRFQFPSMCTPRSEVRVGQIMKQNIKNESSKQIRQQILQKIKNIDEKIVIEYCSRQKRITQKSLPTEIFNFFVNLCLACKIVIRSPHIKKYKNCIYFGYTIEKDLTYEGFLYFYDGKIYYGEFYNGYKHGLGVELNFIQNIKMKGQFKQGHKTGKFYIEKQNEKYIGYLENGIYQGQGRLTTQDYIYQGLFEGGEKNGYGEQYYPKTGVRITGIFRKGVLQKTRVSKSIPELRTKSKISSSKEKERLQMVRKKSLEKHNQRMNKIKEKTGREGEYQMQFDGNQSYNDPPKIQFNASKLEMYRQPPQKLPKICQQFEYSFETGNNYESINSLNGVVREERHLGIKYRRPVNAGGMCQRMQTNQLQQPLPVPCLSVLRVNR